MLYLVEFSVFKISICQDENEEMFRDLDEFGSSKESFNFFTHIKLNTCSNANFLITIILNPDEPLFFQT